MSSDFEKWFVKQFGKRDGTSAHSYSSLTDDQLRIQINHGLSAKVFLEARQEWDRLHDAALKSWAAREITQGLQDAVSDVVDVRLKERSLMRRDKTFLSHLKIVVEPDGDEFHSYCPQLKGLHSSGKTVKEAKKNAMNAAKAYVDSLHKHGEPLPKLRKDSLG